MHLRRAESDTADRDHKTAKRAMCRRVYPVDLSSRPRRNDVANQDFCCPRQDVRGQVVVGVPVCGIHRGRWFLLDRCGGRRSLLGMREIM